MPIPARGISASPKSRAGPGEEKGGSEDCRPENIPRHFPTVKRFVAAQLAMRANDVSLTFVIGW